MTCAVFFKRSIVFVIAATVVGTVVMARSAKAQDARPASNYTVRTLPLPDNGMGDVSMDYIAFDPATNSLWVPGGNTGAVDVVDLATGKVRQIPNLPTAQVQARGGTRVLGPSGVSIGDGVVYIGNRGGAGGGGVYAPTPARGGGGDLGSRAGGGGVRAATQGGGGAAAGGQGRLGPQRG